MSGSKIDDKMKMPGAAIDDVTMSGSVIDDKLKMPGAAIDDEVMMSGSVIDKLKMLPGSHDRRRGDDVGLGDRRQAEDAGRARTALVSALWAAQRARAKNQKRNERRKAAWQREHAQQLKEVRASYRLCRLAPTDRRTSTSEICAPPSQASIAVTGEGPTTGDDAKNVDDAQESQQISNTYSAAVKSLLALALRAEMFPGARLCDARDAAARVALQSRVPIVRPRGDGRCQDHAQMVAARLHSCTSRFSEEPALKPRSEKASKRERKRRKRQRVDEAPRFSNCRLMLVLVCAHLARAMVIAMALKLEGTGVKLSDVYSGAVSETSSCGAHDHLRTATDAMTTRGRVLDTTKSTGRGATVDDVRAPAEYKEVVEAPHIQTVERAALRKNSTALTSELEFAKDMNAPQASIAKMDLMSCA